MVNKMREEKTTILLNQHFYVAFTTRADLQILITH